MSESSGFPDPIATERAILQTVLYSDLFDYPLTPDEIAHYLIGVSSDSGKVRARLAAPAWLNGQIARVDGYVTIRGREGLVRQRHERARRSRKIWRRAHSFALILSWLPFVRMVGVTGALSMENSGEGDDVDVIIVTAPNRVWFARALSLLVVYAGRLGSSTLCPNYLLSEEALLLEPRSLYTAHEFVQMVPLYGFKVYERMRAANRWIEEVLPNANRPFRPRPEQQPGMIGRSLKRMLEYLLSGRQGDRLEKWEMRRKLRKFQPKLLNSNGAAVLTKDQVKGHFDDHGASISRAYQARLEEFRLAGPGRAPDRESLAGKDVPGPPRPDSLSVPG
jgi:hypothetical protein